MEATIEVVAFFRLDVYLQIRSMIWRPRKHLNLVKKHLFALEDAISSVTLEQESGEVAVSALVATSGWW